MVQDCNENIYIYDWEKASHVRHFLGRKDPSVTNILAEKGVLLTVPLSIAKRVQTLTIKYEHSDRSRVNL